MKRSRSLLMTLAVAAGLVAVMLGLRGQYARFVAEHWRKQLDTVPDERAMGLLRGAAQLGEPGIPVLVEALGSRRESVARGGKRVLLDEVSRWETLAAQDASPKLAVLASALAGRVEQFDPGARVDAANLAARILQWPLDDGAVDRGQVIAACEKVLRTTGSQRQLLADRRRVGGPESAALGEQHPAEAVTRLDRGPAGTEAGRPESGTPSPGPSAESRLADVHPVQPPDQLLRRPDRTGSEPEGGQAGPAGRAVESGGGEPPDLPRLRSLALLQGGPGPDQNAAGADFTASPLAGVDTVELMWRLRSDDDSVASRAGTELTRRGFTEVHLQLARQLFDPDPEIRKRLARLLPELQTVDAAPWLLRLARDEDSGVRLLAISLLATTGDPRLLDEIERIARADPAPQVQLQAERIARQRRGVEY